MKNKRRRGQVLILIAAAVLPLSLVLSLTCDVGHLATTRSWLQNAADSASLAAMLELWEQRANDADEDVARDSAEEEAETMAGMNHDGCGLDLTWGHWVDGAFVPKSESTGPIIAVNAVKVEPFRRDEAPAGPVDTFFARLIGIEQVHQQASAIARYQHRGLSPFALDENDVPEPGQLFTMYDDTETAPGNCGVLDFNGGENSLSEARDWAYDGYFGPFNIDPDTGDMTVEGSTGLKSSLKQPIRYHITEGDVVTVCIYNSVSGVGEGVTYNIIGFASAVIETITTDESDNEIISVTSRLESKYIHSTGETDGTMRNFMKLQIME